MRRLRHAEDTAEIVHVLNAVADDNQPRRIRGGEKFVKVRIDEIGGVGDDALVPPRFALPIERLFVGELHADALCARLRENAAQRVLRVFAEEYFVDRLVRL